jgi:trimethylamine--corrinoid protein Co-methyltransferase
MFSPALTFRPTLSVINDGQIEQIHQATLEVLERTGIQISHQGRV